MTDINPYKIPPQVVRKARKSAIEGYPVYIGGYRATKLGKIIFVSPEKPISKGRLGKAYSIVAFPSSPKDEAALREASGGVLGGGPSTANRGGIGTMRARQTKRGDPIMLVNAQAHYRVRDMHSPKSRPKPSLGDLAPEELAYEHAKSRGLDAKTHAKYARWWDGGMRELAEISDSLNVRLWIPERVSSRGLLRTRHMTDTNIASLGKAVKKTTQWCKKRGRKVEASTGVVIIRPSLRPKPGQHHFARPNRA